MPMDEELPVAEHNELRHLGKQSEIRHEPDISILETVPNRHAGGQPFCARFTCPEFTSLCPVTAQPDFAHIVIDYIPRKFLIESKSLKLYLFSFRNHGEFHESCTHRIFDDFKAKADPAWIRVAAYWYPRGGIPIDVFIQSGLVPLGVLVPELTTPMYRGRG